MPRENCAFTKCSTSRKGNSSFKASLAKLAHLNAPVKFISPERVKLTLRLKGWHVNSWKNKY